ncbi:TPA: TGS domain-containing protein, partial [Candidatus Woesearchaeota archaeon]|nr:TGS domain-containing protein [Candidatus Woesearchaeota archaeon]HIH54886.1 TGS domain-containing protein [Candidatus Woesearchaeota archaeon]HIJ02454.1 TGS domain-containing protein [Candidatus Woesearchaeota archaeon]
MVKIIFPDGSHEEWNECTAMQIAEKISPHLAKEAVAAKVNGNVVDLSFKINQDSQIQILTGKDPEGLDTIRHSSAHLLAQALLRLYPGTKLTIGPVVENGFYYDVDSDRNFTPEDLRVIEQEMEKIVKEDLEVFRKELTKREALKLFATNEYKIEMINEMPDTELITAYQQGEFIDLCRGPHVPSTSKLKAWKLTKVAGAYWRADAKNKQLQRIYGVAFNDKKELDAYLKMMEEAEKRDHRKIGRE